MFHAQIDIPSSIKSLREDGFVIVKNFLDPMFRGDLYHSFLKRCSAGIAHAGSTGLMNVQPNMCMLDAPLTLHPNAVQLAICEPIVGILEGYLNTNIQLSYCSAYRTTIVKNEFRRKRLKTPGVFSGWHSDANVIAPDRGFRFCVAMYYLSDVKPGCGALELVRGSHLYGGKKRPWNPEEIDNFDDNYVEVHAPAGTLIIFDMEMIHRAGIPTDSARDIIRMMYGPVGTFGEPLIYSNHTLPGTLSEKDKQVLRIGCVNTSEIPLSHTMPPKPKLLDRLLARGPAKY